MHSKGFTVIDRRRRPEPKSVDAPVVIADPLELTDQRLDPTETVIKLREELLKQESRKRIHGQDELEDSQRSTGSRLTFEDVIRRVKKLNPGIFVKEGMPGAVALYVRKKAEEMTPEDEMSPAQAAIFGVKLPKDDFFRHHKYCGGFLKEDLPEWGSVTVDTSLIAHHEVEKGHNRGWRSVLIALIKARVITYQQAILEFGDPKDDPRARLWFEQLDSHK